MSPVIDNNNLQFIKRAIEVIQLVHDYAIVDTKTEGLTAYIKMIKQAEDFGNTALKSREFVTHEVPGTIDRLVREKRVQEIPAKRIKRAIELASAGERDKWEKIKRELLPYDKLNEFTKSYVLAISRYNNPDPSLQQLHAVSSYSRSDWSKTLRQNSGLLLIIRRELQKKHNQAKPKGNKKKLWFESIRMIEERIRRYAEGEFKRKKLISSDRLSRKRIQDELSPDERAELE